MWPSHEATGRALRGVLLVLAAVASQPPEGLAISEEVVLHAKDTLSVPTARAGTLVSTELVVRVCLRSESVASDRVSSVDVPLVFVKPSTP